MNKEALQLLLKRLKNYHGDPSCDDLWDIIQGFDIELQEAVPSGKTTDETTSEGDTDIDGGNGGNHPPGGPGKP